MEMVVLVLVVQDQDLVVQDQDLVDFPSQDVHTSIVPVFL